MNTRRKKPHRAWTVLLGLVMVQAGLTGIAINCAGILFSAVLKDTGFKAGDLSLYYTIRSLTSALLLVPLINLFFRRGGRKLLAGMCILTAAGFGMMSVFSHVWQWYFAAVIAGIGTCIIMVIIPVVVNNWFVRNRGLASGIAMASSGLAGVLFGPACSIMIEQAGWRISTLAIMITILILTVPACLFLIRLTPQEIGMEPFGQEQISDSCPGVARTGDNYLKNVPFWLFLFVTAAVLSAFAIVQFSNQIPSFAASIGYPSITGATMVSLIMCGNVGGKLAFGLLVDGFGTYNTACGTILLGSFSLLLMGFGGGSLACLYCGAVLFGLMYSIATISAPLICLDIYGPDKYKDPLGKINASSQIASALISPLIAYTFDFMGTFRPVFLIGATLCFLAAVLTIIAKFAKMKLLRKQSVTGGSNYSVRNSYKGG